MLVVCSTLNALTKRPEVSSNCKQPATVTGAPEPMKNYRPAITVHTFDPPPPSLFEKPIWQINDDTNADATDVCICSLSSTFFVLCIKEKFLHRFQTILHYLVNTQYHLNIIECEILVLKDIHQLENDKNINRQQIILVMDESNRLICLLYHKNIMERQSINRIQAFEHFIFT